LSRTAAAVGGDAIALELVRSHLSVPSWRSMASEDSPRPVIPISKVLICLLAAVLGLAGAGSAAAGLRPDPRPIPKPPPPQAPASSLPAQPQPAPPPAARAPSADETAASRLAAAARARAARARAAEARARAARLRAQRVKAAREAARNKQIAARRGLPGVPQGLSKPETASAAAVAFLFVSLGAAVLLLGLALIPARAVPWYWAARALVDRRGELAFFGAYIPLLAAAFFLLAR